MIFVDTGYLIALTDPDDALRARALAWARVARGPFLTSDAVLLEFLNHFASPAARPRALALYDRIHARNDWKVEALDSNLIAPAVSLYRARSDKFWSLTDCISFTLMIDRGITRALAYDHHFEQAGFEALLRRDPP